MIKTILRPLCFLICFFLPQMFLVCVLPEGFASVGAAIRQGGGAANSIFGTLLFHLYICVVYMLLLFGYIPESGQLVKGDVLKALLGSFVCLLTAEAAKAFITNSYAVFFIECGYFAAVQYMLVRTLCKNARKADKNKAVLLYHAAALAAVLAGAAAIYKYDTVQRRLECLLLLSLAAALFMSAELMAFTQIYECERTASRLAAFFIIIAAFAALFGAKIVFAESGCITRIDNVSSVADTKNGFKIYTDERFVYRRKGGEDIVAYHSESYEVQFGSKKRTIKEYDDLRQGDIRETVYNNCPAFIIDQKLLVYYDDGEICREKGDYTE